MYDGRPEDALGEADLSIEAADDTERFDHAPLNALLGRPSEARHVIAYVEARNPVSYASDTHLSLLYAALGEEDRALDPLEKELPEGDRVLWSFFRGFGSDGIRRHPRFRALHGA